MAEDGHVGDNGSCGGVAERIDVKTESGRTCARYFCQLFGVEREAIFVASMAVLPSTPISHFVQEHQGGWARVIMTMLTVPILSVVRVQMRSVA